MQCFLYINQKNAKRKIPCDFFIAFLYKNRCLTCFNTTTDKQTDLFHKNFFLDNCCFTTCVYERNVTLFNFKHVFSLPATKLKIYLLFYNGCPVELET